MSERDKFEGFTSEDSQKAVSEAERIMFEAKWPGISARISALHRLFRSSPFEENLRAKLMGSPVDYSQALAFLVRDLGPFGQDMIGSMMGEIRQQLDSRSYKELFFGGIKFQKLIYYLGFKSNSNKSIIQLPINENFPRD